MSDTPYVSIIIPTYNDWDRLKLCLEALSKQTYPEDQFEVLIVNNNPGDRPSYDIPLCNYRLLEEARPGSYAARNAAVKIAKGKIFAFTDSDCIPDHDWLKFGVKYLLTGNDRVAGNVELFTVGVEPTLTETFELIFAFNQKRNAEKGISVTANLFCFGYCFEKTGLFNETLLSGGDFEWGYRADKLGFTISYQKDVNVRHPARQTLSDLLKKSRRKVGGSQAIQLVSQKPRTLLRSLFPPFAAFKSVFNYPNISLWCKLRLIFLVYFLRQYSFFYFFLVRNGWSKPVR